MTWLLSSVKYFVYTKNKQMAACRQVVVNTKEAFKCFRDCAVVLQRLLPKSRRLNESNNLNPILGKVTLFF